MSSSSSSSDSEDEDTRMRSEQNIPISSTPRFDPFAATVTIDKKKRSNLLSDLLFCYKMSEHLLLYGKLVDLLRWFQISLLAMRTTRYAFTS